MIEASFESKTGLIKILIDNDGANYATDIISLGSLSVDMDITPESITIDSIQSLFGRMQVSLMQRTFNREDLFDVVIGALQDAFKDGKDYIEATLRIEKYDNTTVFEFPMWIKDGDVRVNDFNETLDVTLTPFFDETVTMQDVFDQAEAESSIVTFVIDDESEDEKQYNALLLDDFIRIATRKIFNNNFDLISKTPASFSSKNTAENGTEVFAFIDPNSSEPNTLAFVEFLGGTGLISWSTQTGKVFGGLDEDGWPEVFDVLGRRIRNASPPAVFLEEVNVGENIFVFSTRRFLGKVDSIESNIELKLEQPPTFTLPSSGNVFLPSSYSIEKRSNLNKRLAIDVLTSLGAGSGCFFGCMFSKNFFINRIDESNAEDVVIGSDIIKEEEITFEYRNPFLSQIFVQSLSSQQEEGQDNFGKLEPLDRNLPNLQRDGVVIDVNKNAQKDLNIQIGIGYPFLSKGVVGIQGAINAVQATGQITGIDRLTMPDFDGTYRVRVGDDVSEDVLIAQGMSNEQARDAFINAMPPQSDIGQKWIISNVGTDGIAFQSETAGVAFNNIQLTIEHVSGEDGLQFTPGTTSGGSDGTEGTLGLDGNLPDAPSIESQMITNAALSYRKALAESTYIEFTVIGADRIKPFSTIVFNTTVPEKYQLKRYRITSLKYDWVNDECSVRAYRIDDAPRIPVKPSFDDRAQVIPDFRLVDTFLNLADSISVSDSVALGNLIGDIPPLVDTFVTLSDGVVVNDSTSLVPTSPDPRIDTFVTLSDSVVVFDSTGLVPQEPTIPDQSVDTFVSLSDSLRVNDSTGLVPNAPDPRVDTFVSLSDGIIVSDVTRLNIPSVKLDDVIVDFDVALDSFVTTDNSNPVIKQDVLVESGGGNGTLSKRLSGLNERGVFSKVDEAITEENVRITIGDGKIIVVDEDLERKIEIGYRTEFEKIPQIYIDNTNEDASGIKNASLNYERLAIGGEINSVSKFLIAGVEGLNYNVPTINAVQAITPTLPSTVDALEIEGTCATVTTIAVQSFLRGIVGGVQGRLIEITNIGSNVLTIVNESTIVSDATRRIRTRTGGNVAYLPNRTVRLRYINSKWHEISNP